MHWKFFELAKFAESSAYKSIDASSPLKNQWLEFLLDCSKQKEEPERHETIKKGYEIMKFAKWTPDQQLLYWKQKRTAEDLAETIEDRVEASKVKAKAKGKAEGKILGALEFGISDADIIKKFGVSQDYIDSIRTQISSSSLDITHDLIDTTASTTTDNAVEISGDTTEGE